jgi:Protein of unknown function (DUF2934)
MANSGSQSQAGTIRADRRHGGASTAKQSAQAKKMTAARTASEESTGESQGNESDAHPAQSDGSHIETSQQDLISRRAYERFQMRGGEHGRDQDDWLEAEREMNKGVGE